MNHDKLKGMNFSFKHVRKGNSFPLDFLKRKITGKNNTTSKFKRNYIVLFPFFVFFFFFMCVCLEFFSSTSTNPPPKKIPSKINKLMQCWTNIIRGDSYNFEQRIQTLSTEADSPFTTTRWVHPPQLFLLNRMDTRLVMHL